MSMQSQGVPLRSNGFGFEYLATAVIVIVAVLALLFLASGRQTTLRADETGFDGLQIWINQNGVSGQTFTGGWPLDPSGIGLLIIPLFDTELIKARSIPKNKEELLRQQDEYDLQLTSVVARYKQIPSLIILPKWRSGMRLTEIAHPELLVDGERVKKSLRRLLLDDSAELSQAKNGFSDFSYQSKDQGTLEASIYSSQSFTSSRCIPLVGSNEAIILGECSYGYTIKSKFLLLSDPDLLNNHGLKLGDNAAVAIDLLKTRAKEKRVVIDYSIRSWLLTDTRHKKRDRTWADLLRFFEPPFQALWIIAGCLFVLFLWRGGTRFGPTRKFDFNDASKRSNMIDAFAKIMRLSDQNGSIAKEYVNARLSNIASTLFGHSQANYMANKDRFLGYLDKRDKKLAEDLLTAIDNVQNLPVKASGEVTMKHIDRLEIVLERVVNES